MIVETNCSICGRKLGGKQRFKESRVGIFSPVVKDGEITHFAMGDNRLALCKSCTQSLYSWINNRRSKKKQAKNIEKIKKMLARSSESDLVYPDNSGSHDCGYDEKFNSLMTDIMDFCYKQ